MLAPPGSQPTPTAKPGARDRCRLERAGRTRDHGPPPRWNVPERGWNSPPLRWDERARAVLAELWQHAYKQLLFHDDQIDRGEDDS